MRWADGYIAADWGTTNRRAYLIDSSGRCVDEFEDGKGVLSVESDGFPAAVAEIRERLGDKPLLLAGMVGSNRGWKEVPYVPCPAGIDDLARSLVWVGEREAIVPGVSYQGEGRADVMRGEEVQLLGAVADGTVPPGASPATPARTTNGPRLPTVGSVLPNGHDWRAVQPASRAQHPVGPVAERRRARRRLRRGRATGPADRRRGRRSLLRARGRAPRPP